MRLLLVKMPCWQLKVWAMVVSLSVWFDTSQEEVAELFNLPDYTYPVFGMALGVPNEEHEVKPRLPLHQMVLRKNTKNSQLRVIEAYDRVQADYAGARATTSWSQRLAEQFGQARTKLN